MFGDVQHTIRDAQYRDALLKIHESPPEANFPVPSHSQLKEFVERHLHLLGLERLLDSPIGVYFFKDYLSNRFLNFTIIVDFLIQFERVRKLEAPDSSELEELVFLAEELPQQYRKQVREIQQQLRILHGEYAGVEATDLVLEDEADPVLVSKHFPDADGDTVKDEVFNNGLAILAQIPVGVDHSVQAPEKRVINFGGMQMGSMTNLKRVDARSETELREPDEVPRRLSREKKVVSAVEVDEQEVVQSVASNEEDGEFKRMQVVLANQRSARRVLLELFHELGTLIEKKAADLFKSFKESNEWLEMLKAMWASEVPPTPSDFRRFRMLGKGAFGTVSSVKHKATGQLTAMKMMNKRLVKGKRAWPLVNAEKEVLQLLGDNPSSFTVWLKYAFEDAEYFYMAIPLCTGGDLAYHLQESVVFDVERVRFYGAEIFEGLSHLHKLGIIYRDLKPENIILDSEGHCRISDMGLAAVTNGTRIKSKAGTPGYWAPEVLVKLFYSYAVDFWSLGVVLFEFLIGTCPFSRSNTGMDRDKATRYWPIKYPEYLPLSASQKNATQMIPFPDDVRSLLKGLLKRRASKRFTEEQIRKHEFFRSIKWELLRQRMIPPPFLPSDAKINAGASKHLEDNSGEKMFKNVELTKEDEVENFAYISKYPHELDIVNVYAMKRDHPGIILPTEPTSKSRKNSSISVLKSIKNTISVSPATAATPDGCVIF